MEGEGYVLQVVRFIAEEFGENGWREKGGKREHVGFMKAKFRTKEDCCAYYDTNNSHMRKLNAHGTYASDWDPNTKLIYIVREDHDIIEDVLPFQ